MELIKASLLSAVMQSGGGSVDYCDYIKTLPICQGGGIGSGYHFYIRYEELQNIRYSGVPTVAVSDIGDVIFDYQYRKVFNYFCCVYDNTQQDMLYAVGAASTFNYSSKTRDVYQDMSQQTYFLYDVYTTTPTASMTMSITPQPTQYGMGISATAQQPVHWVRYSDPETVSQEGDTTNTGSVYFNVTEYLNNPIYTALSQAALQNTIKDIVRDLYTNI